MKKLFSFHRLINNDKLMMLLSLVLSIMIWASVLSGPANIEERSIPVSVTVDLTNSYAYESGLRVIGDTTFEVTVHVSGAWSVISGLSENDLRVRPDLTGITGAGDAEVAVNVSRNSSETDYDILSVTPNTVTVVCDYWQEGTTFKVETDVSALTVAQPETYQIGEPVLDTTAFPSGNVTINGPKTALSQIRSVVARVTTAEQLSSMKQYQVPLKALDENGNEVDLTDCVIEELSTGIVTMTVPVWEQRHIQIGYTVLNAPEGIDTQAQLITEPSELDLLGPTADLDALEEQLENIGTVDFSNLSIVNDTVTFPLTIPSTVRAIENPAGVTVRLNTEGIAQKTITLVVTSENTVIVGHAEDVTVTIPQQTFEEILLVGNESAINAISAAALSLEIDVGEAPTLGTKQYTAALKINGYDDVWAYYGTQADGLTVYATLS